MIGVAAVGLGTGAPLFAQDAKYGPKLASCKVGQRVVLPGGQQGTVIGLNGSACNVQADGYKDYNTWAAWMLYAVPGTPAAQIAPAAKLGGQPTAGFYQCYGGAAGNMKLRFGPGWYENEQGKRGTYTMRPSGQMALATGPWAGFYAKTLSPTKVGLTSKPDGTFYNMTCDRK